MTPLKIGIVCYPTFGGSGVLATELGMALSLKGHEIHFISYQPPVRLHFHPNIYYHEVSVPTYPLFDFPPYETALASTLVNIVTKNNLDVLHVHYAIPHASAAYFAKQILEKKGRKIAIVTTLHGTDITLVGRDHSYGHVVEFSINQSDAVTAVSQNLKNQTLEFFQIEKDITVVPNFVDTHRFRQTDKQHFKAMLAPNNERVLSHVSNFRKVKRIPDVLKIFKKVREKMPAILLMVGDGPERQMAEEVTRNWAFADDVRFLGRQDQMDEILSIADLFLLPSESESFGLAALEAMSCGVPVISTNAGGLPEINIDGKTGFLSNVGDTKEMAEKAIYILEDNARLKGFKKAALEQAGKFEKESVIPMYEQLYAEVVGNMSK